MLEEWALNGLALNIRNYTAYIPEVYDILRSEIERIIELTEPCRSLRGGDMRGSRWGY